jgi:hypothetical protein
LRDSRKKEPTMTFQITAPASYVPQTAIAFSADDGAALVSATSPLPISEPSYRTAASIAPDAPFAPPRAIAVVAQAAGNVAFRFADASTIVVPVSPGLSILPFAATQIVASGTTAAASFHALA